MDTFGISGIEPHRVKRVRNVFCRLSCHQSCILQSSPRRAFSCRISTSLVASVRHSHSVLSSRASSSITFLQGCLAFAFSRLCELSFHDVPSIDLRITPLGMALTDFPGIPESLRGTIVKLLTKGMVHPKNITLDVCKIYETLRMRQRGGIGGLLTVNLSSASRLCAPTIAGGTSEVFCECTFGKHTFRTPIRSGTESVQWDWNCAIRLDEKIPALLDQEMSISLFNSKSLGEPTLLAKGTVSPYLSHIDHTFDGCSVLFKGRWVGGFIFRDYFQVCFVRESYV